MSRCALVCGPRFCAEVDVLAGHFFESLLFDALHETGGGAVVKISGRSLWGELEIDVDGVSLRGANLGFVLGEGEAMLGVLPDDVLEALESQVLPVLFEAGEEFVGFCPGLLIEFQADGGRVVFEDEAEEAADFLF